MDELLSALGRQAGLTGRYLASGVGGMGAALANPVAWGMNQGLDAVGSDYRFPEQYELLQRALDETGLPRPEGALEKGVGFASELGVPDPSDSARVVSALSHMVDPSSMDNLIQAMTVFHGSPHKWDEVDLSKVGTGEGAQAYGHGFYAAENKAVGQEYADKLGNRRFSDLNDRFGKIEIGGKSFDELGITDRDGTFADIAYGEDRTGAGIDALLNGRTRENAMLEIAQKNEARWAELSSDPDYPFEDYATEHKQKWSDIVKRLGAGEKVDAPQGHLYELDLPDETIDKMLDWDAPLSEQPESVRKALEAVQKRVFGRRAWERLKDDPQAGSNMTGRDLYQRLAESESKTPGLHSDGQAAASRIFSEAGIPGIKYLDGTSRSAGEGTRNFVVFDEQYITPLTRNGENLRSGLAARYPGRMFLEPDRDWFHGTSAEVTDDFAFDANRIGSATDDGWLGEGFYFTPHDDVAPAYGKSTIRARLELDNPFIFPEDVNPVKFVKDKGGPEAFTKWAKSQGYDGAISDRVLHQAVVFDDAAGKIKTIK